MRPLNVARFKQDPAHCAIAASAVVANFQNRKIDYQLAKYVCQNKVVKDTSEGLWSGQIGLLLNRLGFKKVTLVSSDMDIYDYTWSQFTRPKLIELLRKTVRTYSIDEVTRGNAKCSYKFLEESPANKIVIDYHFADFIRESLDAGFPLVLSFNWTIFFQFPKYNEKGKLDPHNGSPEHHAVVARGYNTKGVHIVDSHHRFYKYSRKQYREGYYLIPWEELLTIMGTGDLVIGEDFDPSVLDV